MNTSTGTTAARGAAIFLLALASIAGPCVTAQTLSPQQASKVDAAVLERAGKNQEQRVIVELEDDDIVAREAQERRARGLPYNDQALIHESARQYDALKRSVFPSGRLGRNTVADDARNLPSLVVIVPDMAALSELLAHPKVKAVYEVRVYKPALSEQVAVSGRA